MPKVEIYLTAFCPYCTMAIRLLDSKPIEYTSYDVMTDQAMRHEMEQRSQRYTVPQIFIDDVSMGGYDDIALLEKLGKLDVLLGLAAEG